MVIAPLVLRDSLSHNLNNKVKKQYVLKMIQNCKPRYHIFKERNNHVFNLSMITVNILTLMLTQFLMPLIQL